MVIWAVSTWAIVARLVTSPYGRVLRAIREDEVFAQAVGKNTLWFKVSAFALSAALASSAGSLYAHYFTYIDPSSFTVMESILIISMVIIGGADSLWGPIIGAFVLVIPSIFMAIITHKLRGLFLEQLSIFSSSSGFCEPKSSLC